MSEKSPRGRFIESLDAFTAALDALPASELKTQLVRQLPFLQSPDVRNELGNSTSSNVVQVGTQPGGAWEEAGRLVGELDDAALTRTFMAASVAAAACANVHNTITGSAIGTAVQAHTITGDLTFNGF